MGKKIGIGCIILGVLCLLSSAGLLVYNLWEANSGAQSSQLMLEELQQSLEIKRSAEKVQTEQEPETVSQPLDGKMPEVWVDGYASVGILSIPVLELELPVLSEWSYEKLRKAPCQYYGTCYDTDFVIAAHNYRTHFGRLTELQPKDLIVFTDNNGTMYCYEVVLTETLPPAATKEMITSGFDLSLYTCTSGGANRVTVRCKKI